jgi:hypothetical protein
MLKVLEAKNKIGSHVEFRNHFEFFGLTTIFFKPYSSRASKNEGICKFCSTVKTRSKFDHKDKNTILNLGTI